MTRARSLAIIPLLSIGISVHAPGAGPQILRHLVVYEEPGEYLAWPSIVRTNPTDLLVFFCRSEEHLGPDGAILSVRSTDNGATWQRPQLVADTEIDDRECGVTLLAHGGLLLHLWSTFFTPESYERLPGDAYESRVLDRWKKRVGGARYQAAQKYEGAWGKLSSDGGRTWSGRMIGTDAVHGGIRLAGSSLLCASYRTFRDSIGVLGARAPAGPWKLLSVIRSPEPDSVGFGEPHLLQLPGGRVIMMIRATVRPYDDADHRCVLWETYSDDGGRTWAKPFPTSLWGFPPHLLLLADGRVLCSYGYRRAPFGQRACISSDGIQWDVANEVVLRDDAPNGDLGYPASVEIAPGQILTVYYQPNVPRGTVQRMKPPDPGRTKPAILGTLWSVN
jgi:hypothetical protein